MLPLALSYKVKISLTFDQEVKVSLTFDPLLPSVIRKTEMVRCDNIFLSGSAVYGFLGIASLTTEPSGIAWPEETIWLMQ